jgi:hypothetical protein
MCLTSNIRMTLQGLRRSWIENIEFYLGLWYTKWHWYMSF